MKKLIRKSVFETNSSSSHSLSFKYEEGDVIYEGLDKYFRDEDIWINCGACRFADNRTINAKTAYEKIALLVTLWNSDAFCMFPIYTLNTLENIIRKNTGCKNVYFHKIESLCFDWDYSFDAMEDLKDLDHLYNLIFNPKRSIVIKYNTF